MQVLRVATPTLMVVLALGAVVLVVVFALRIVLILFAGILGGVFLNALVRPLMGRFKLPRWAALLLVLMVLVGAAVALALLTGPRLQQEAAQLMRRLPRSLEQLGQHVNAALPGDTRISEFIPDPSAIWSQVRSGLTLTLSAVAAFALAAVAGAFLAFSPDVYRRGMLRLAPVSRREELNELLGELRSRLSRWLLARAIAMTVVGAATAVGLRIIGVPMPLVLGVLAGALAFIPFLGPVLAAVPIVLIAWTVSADTALEAALLYLGVQVLESHLLTPLIESGAVSLPPGVILAAQALAGHFAGILGILVATPLAVVLITLVSKLYVRDLLEREDVQRVAH